MAGEAQASWFGTHATEFKSALTSSAKRPGMPGVVTWSMIGEAIPQGALRPDWMNDGEGAAFLREKRV
jgi:hypothetical protein